MQAPVFLLLLLPALAALPLARRGGRVRAALAGATLLSLVLALARPVVRIPRRAGTVVVVADRSASLPPAERDAQKALLDAVAARRAEGERLGVVAFGETAAVEQAPQPAPFAGFRASPGAEGSDLDAALDLALSLVPPRDEARILVLSDGRATGPDPLAGAARRAAARGVPVDVRAQTPPRAGDTAIVRVDAPLRLRPGEPLLATAWISSPAPQTLAYAFHRDRELVARGTRAVPAGLSPISFRDLPRPEGVSAYTVAVAPATEVESAKGKGNSSPSTQTNFTLSTLPFQLSDPVPENNAARFLVSREGARPLLVVPASEKSGLPALLRGAGVALETRTPAELDLSPASLAAWSGVLVENRRADDFGPVGLANVAAWVRDAGGGLALTGGRNAFGPGGWHKSPVEDILPVSLELRREHRKFPMAIAVALDRSGSMTMPVDGGRTKMDLADQATAEVLDMLADDDRIAVWAVDTAAHLVVPMQSASSARAERKRILSIESMGGGIDVEAAVTAALAALRASDAPIRHLVVFADAADAENPGLSFEMARAARDAGITVSAIGLGTDHDSDSRVLIDLADAGGGLCAFTEDAGELPRLFAQDTMLAAREVMVTNPTLPRFTAALPQLSSRLPLSGAPAVGGYDLTYLRPEGTAAALTTDENEAPLVAFRPVGAGRTAVFTGEADGDLAGPFARWEHAPELHAALARFAAGASESSPAGPAFPLAIPTLTPTSLDLDLYPPTLSTSSTLSTTSTTLPFTLSTFNLTVLRTTSSGRTHSERVPLEWTAPDRLSASIPLHGGDTVLPVLSDPATGATRTLPPARLPYSPEYAPDPDGAGEALLGSLADLTGGQRLADPAAVWSLLPREPVPFELAPFLYLLAALLLLLDIFDRRTAFLSRRFTARKERKVERVEAVETVEEVPNRRQSIPSAPATPATPATPSTSSTPPAAPPPEDPFARAKRRSASRTRGG